MRGRIRRQRVELTAALPEIEQLRAELELPPLRIRVRPCLRCGSPRASACFDRICPHCHSILELIDSRTVKSARSKRAGIGPERSA